MYLYQNQSLPFEARAAALVAEMTLEEKVSQMSNTSPAIERLGVRAWQWWNEAAHGVTQVLQRVKDATSFPTCLALSQTWNPELIKAVALAISDEIRAYYNLQGKELDYWCPTVNMGRDPRWGRNDEAFGEDPFLAGKLAAAYVLGLQDYDGTYYKAIATPKHFACNNSEYNRVHGTSNMDEATLREYYLPVFERCVREGGAYSIMTSYNRVNGVPSSVNSHLLRDILREEWGFKGYIVSDDGAVGDVGPNAGTMLFFQRGQFYGKTMEEASALVVNAGCDLCTGCEHETHLSEALRQGLTSEKMLDRSLIRAFTARMKLGTFDNPEKIRFHSLGQEAICSDAHAVLAEKSAAESLVLLKNKNNLLPINTKKVKRIAVIGPNAIYRQLGSYSIGGSPDSDSDTRVCIPPLAGIKAVAEQEGIEVIYRKGWNYAQRRRFGGFGQIPEVFSKAAEELGMTPEDYAEKIIDVKRRPTQEKYRRMFDVQRTEPGIGLRFPVDDPDLNRPDEALFAEALEAAKAADLVVMVLGTDPSSTGEGRDRTTLDLPYDQNEKVRQVLAVNPNVAAVIISVGPVTGAFLDETPGILCATYAGESQGAAIADVLFGRVNPSGRLSETWYENDSDLPPFGDYGIRPFDTMNEKGRTYQYFLGKPRFQFGSGLSYTAFTYDNFRLDADRYDANSIISATVDVKNTGSRAGSEVVQLYMRSTLKYDNKPFKQLVGFDKIQLEPGQTQTVTLHIPVSQLKFWNAWKERFEVEPSVWLAWFGADCEHPVTVRAQFKTGGSWNAPLSAVTVLPDRQILQNGETSSLTLSATLEDAQHLDASTLPIILESSDESVIRIVNGRAVACGAGAATVTASLMLGGVTKCDTIGFCVI